MYMYQFPTKNVFIMYHNHINKEKNSKKLKELNSKKTMPFLKG